MSASSTSSMVVVGGVQLVEQSVEHVDAGLLRGLREVGQQPVVRVEAEQGRVHGCAGEHRVQQRVGQLGDGPHAGGPHAVGSGAAFLAGPPPGDPGAEGGEQGEHGQRRGPGAGLDGELAAGAAVGGDVVGDPDDRPDGQVVGVAGLERHEMGPALRVGEAHGCRPPGLRDDVAVDGRPAVRRGRVVEGVGRSDGQGDRRREEQHGQAEQAHALGGHGTSVSSAVRRAVRAPGPVPEQEPGRRRRPSRWRRRPRRR